MFQLCSNEHHITKSANTWNVTVFPLFVFYLFNLSHSINLVMECVSFSQSPLLLISAFVKLVSPSRQSPSFVSLTSSLLCMATKIGNYKYREMLTFCHVTLFDTGGYRDSEYGYWQWQWLSVVADDQLWPCIYSELHFVTSQISWRQLPSISTVLNKHNPGCWPPQRMYSTSTHSHHIDTRVTFRSQSDILYNVWTRLSTWCCSVQNTPVQTWRRILDWHCMGCWTLVSGITAHRCSC